jgi:heme/copper-type cytochrome/quinol oxidase subunit 2
MKGFVTIHTQADFQKWMDEREAELKASESEEDSVWK